MPRSTRWLLRFYVSLLVVLAAGGVRLLLVEDDAPLRWVLKLTALGGVWITLAVVALMVWLSGRAYEKERR